jgi:hypothetical protein
MGMAGGPSAHPAPASVACAQGGIPIPPAQDGGEHDAEKGEFWRPKLILPAAREFICIHERHWPCKQKVHDVHELLPFLS